MVLLVLAVAVSVKAGGDFPFRAIDFYENTNYGGRVEHGGEDEIDCEDLDVLPNKFQSIKNNGHCVRLYQGADCRGASVQVTAASPFKGDLNTVNFDGTNTRVANNVGSYILC
jgi:hypothetical protein